MVCGAWSECSRLGLASQGAESYNLQYKKSYQPMPWLSFFVMGDAHGPGCLLCAGPQAAPESARLDPAAAGAPGRLRDRDHPADRAGHAAPIAPGGRTPGRYLG